MLTYYFFALPQIKKLLLFIVESVKYIKLSYFWVQVFKNSMFWIPENKDV